AFISSARGSAQLSLTTGRAQQMPRSRIIGRCLTATSLMIRIHRRLSMDSKEPGGNMSEIREAVRSRYADAAKKIAVLQPEPGVGCCQVDGPDCGCAGSY